MPHLAGPYHNVIFILAGLSCAFAAHARQGEPPRSFSQRAKSAVIVPIEEISPIDVARTRAESDARAHIVGPHTKRMQVAVGTTVAIDPARNGIWTVLADGSALWRVSVRARGATDLRLGFARYALPPGATLHVIGSGNYYQGPFTTADAIDGRFEAPVIPGDTATIELHVPDPTTFPTDALELDSVGAGFRDRFGLAKTDSSELGASGACNVNVACPLGQPYADVARAVGQYEVRADDSRNYFLCTGTLVADVPRDRRNYFLTAAHCVTSASEAASMVIYWNYQSTRCNQLSAPAGGYLNDNQQGAVLRATRADVDFSLVELSQTPDPAWNVHYNGWNATGAIPVATIGIHHPSGDVKKVTKGSAAAIISSCISDTPTASNTHWETGPYAYGTTENGSSGSGLFVAMSDRNQARLLIGTLSGGDAGCSSTVPSQPNAGTDCYGRLSIAWNGTSAATRLRDWLDPANTSATSITGADIVSPADRLPAHSRRPIPAILLRANAHP
ncbi:MAG: trypsin-like serine protease [Dokdonella sp.]